MAVGFVRAARADEAGEIARIQLGTWRTAYPDIVPADVLDALDETALAERWRQAVTDPPSGRHHVLVAVEATGEPESGPPHDGGRVVGFAAIGPADADSAAPDEETDPADTGAVVDLLVEPRWGRRGHGSRLLAAAVEHWRGDGRTRALAWAFERDTAVHGLLTAAGWEPDGVVRTLDMAGTPVRQERLLVTFDTDDGNGEQLA